MTCLAGQRIFSVDGASYTWEDLVLAACLWGDWQALEARVRDGLACLARLDELDEDDADALDEADVEAAAEEFRYARDLIAAADLEAWLQARGLTVESWLDVIRRGLLRERWAADLDGIRAEYDAPEDDTAAAVVSEAICSGVAAELARRLAARAAVHAPTTDAPADGDTPAAVDEATEAAIARALPGLPPAVRRERLAVLARLEASWRRLTAATAPAAAVQSLLGSRRLDWVRLTLSSVVAPDEDVAHEVALCVREDGRTLTEIAAEAGLAVRTGEVWLEEMDDALRDAVVGARPGEVLGPLGTKEGPTVVVVAGKRAPSADDPAVRARAEEALLARTVERAIADRVTWHVTL